MQHITQIKMRKDICILRDEYKIPINTLAKTLVLTERTIREFLEGRNLSKKNFLKLHNGLQTLIHDIKIAEQYEGFKVG